MNAPMRVVLDGHDGAGKSTIAEALSAKRSLRYIKPFHGSLGDFVAWAWQTERYELADAAARGALEFALSAVEPKTSVVFDRHWLTMFTVLPESLWPSWTNKPRTILCWTDPITTSVRLRDRGEEPGSLAHHELYCERYLSLARRFEVPVVDTTHLSVPEAIDQIESILQDISGLNR